MFGLAGSRLMVVLVAAASSAAAWVFLSQGFALWDTSHASGWTLVGLSLLLLAFGIRKKLPHPPLFSAGPWLRLHLGAGITAALVFLFHLRGAPDSPFEWLLFSLFVLTMAGGVIGWVLSRSIPRILTALDEEVIYERIPLFCRDIGDRARELVVEAGGSSSRSILGALYTRHLAAFFGLPKPWWRKFSPQARGSRMLHEVRKTRRYLSDNELPAADELERLIRRRADLDTHHLWQGLLKRWLFFHVPLAGALVLLVVVHILLVHAFSGTAS